MFRRFLARVGDYAHFKRFHRNLRSRIPLDCEFGWKIRSSAKEVFTLQIVSRQCRSVKIIGKSYSMTREVARGASGVYMRPDERVKRIQWPHRVPAQNLCTRATGTAGITHRLGKRSCQHFAPPNTGQFATALPLRSAVEDGLKRII